MGQRLKHYLDLYDSLCKKELTPEEASQHCSQLLIQIQFFQHERLIHLCFWCFWCHTSGITTCWKTVRRNCMSTMTLYMPAAGSF